MSEKNSEGASNGYPSIDDAEPEEQGGPVARAGFTYQDYIAADLVFDMIDDPAIAKVHCETSDDIVIVWERQDCTPRVAEFVQVKTTTKDSLWSCARLCGSANDDPGISLFEKSLAKDRVKEEALFRIVTLQGVQSALRPLTYERGHSARDLSADPITKLCEEIDERCPNVASDKGGTSAFWLERALWVEGAPQDMLHRSLLLRVMTGSANDGGAALLVDQAEKVLLSLLAWVRRAGDAKFVPDKHKKIISRVDAIDWWSSTIEDERNGLSVPSGGKLRRKMTADVASEDIVENALEIRRQYSEEVRSPKFMDGSDIETLSMDVRTRLMKLRVRRFTGENSESPKNFHATCVGEAEDAAASQSENDGVAKTMALGCLYDIVDRCQLAFKSDAQ